MNKFCSVFHIKNGGATYTQINTVPIFAPNKTILNLQAMTVILLLEVL